MSEPMQNPAKESKEISRATEKEMEARVEMCAIMLCDGRRKSEIKRFFANQYGVGSRQVERYLCLARDRLVEETQKQRQELIAESFGFYLSVLSNDNASVSEKINARSKADDLMGLQAPRKSVDVIVDGSDDVEVWVSGLNLQQKLEIIRQAETRDEDAIEVDAVEYVSREED